MALIINTTRSGYNPSQCYSTMTDRKYVRLKDIIKITGLSKATIYRKIEKGLLPKPFHPTERTSLWRLEDIIKFMNGENND